MFYDLNIPKPEFNAEETLRERIERAFKYGYKGFAITTNTDDSVFEKSRKKKDKKKDSTSDSLNIIPLPVDLNQLKENYPRLYFYNRINIKVSDSSNIMKFIQCKEIKKYDIISFQPENQDVLKSLTTVSAMDILSYDPENKCGLQLNRKLYNQFLNKNVYFELTYGPGIADSTARRNLLILSHIYRAVGKSKNIIVSSGAQVTHQIRGPYDVINFNLLFGLSEEQSKNSISQNCEKLLLRAKSQRNSKAVIKMEKIPGVDGEEDL